MKNFLLIRIHRNLRNALDALCLYSTSNDPDPALWNIIRHIHNEIGRLLDKLQGGSNGLS